MSAQVVLITGCSKGIGQATALYLANDPQRRFKVYATMRNASVRQDDLKSKAGSTFEDTLFIKELDVTKQETIDKTVKEIVDEEEGIDVLVNNAGLAENATWWETAPMETFHDIMDVNYFGCVRMTKAVVPYMKAKRNGRILQISSIGGFRALPAMIVQYTASKFALEGFSEAIAPPLRKFNVWVSVIQPGYVATQMAEQFAADPISLWETIAKQIPGDDGPIVAHMVTFNPEHTGTEVQTSDDVVKLIEEVILSPKPDFRYQTSQTGKEMARQRFIDPTGNDTIGAWLNE